MDPGIKKILGWKDTRLGGRVRVLFFFEGNGYVGVPPDKAGDETPEADEQVPAPVDNGYGSAMKNGSQNMREDFLDCHFKGIFNVGQNEGSADPTGADIGDRDSGVEVVGELSEGVEPCRDSSFRCGICGKIGNTFSAGDRRNDCDATRQTAVAEILPSCGDATDHAARVGLEYRNFLFGVEVRVTIADTGYMKIKVHPAEAPDEVVELAGCFGSRDIDF